MPAKNEADEHRRKVEDYIKKAVGILKREGEELFSRRTKENHGHPDLKQDYAELFPENKR
jgi:hypothetical protein